MLTLSIVILMADRYGYLNLQQNMTWWWCVQIFFLYSRQESEPAKFFPRRQKHATRMGWAGMESTIATIAFTRDDVILNK